MIIRPSTYACWLTVTLIVGGEAAVKPQLISTRFATEDVVIASVVVSPPPGDATEMVQRAIDQSQAAGGGVVFLTAGRYRLDGSLTVKEGVTLRGDWAPPSAGKTSAGTLLMPTGHRGETDGPPAIVLERGSGLREVAIWYPDQRPEAISPYPWTIKTSPTVNGDNYTVHNVTLVNAYQGIQVGPEGNELHTIRNLFGTALKTGLSLDSTTDIGRIIDVTLSPEVWAQSGLPGAPESAEQRDKLRAFIGERGVGIDMGRSDWEYLWGVQVSGYGVGMRVRRGARGAANAVMFGCRFETCGTGLALDEMNRVGLSVTNCEFAGADAAVRAGPRFHSTAQFNTCRFAAVAGEAVSVQAGTLTFQNCRFDDWRNTAVHASAGALSLVDCDFRRPGPHCDFGDGVRRVRMLSNRFAGDAQVKAPDRADVMVSHAPMQFDRLDIAAPPSPPTPRPPADRLFIVTDYGANQQAKDNTTAFQRALDAARKAGGGTVYAPAGNYRFAGSLRVPTGVELRGIFDVPHHTISAGTVLMPTAGRGNADGEPFIQLEAHSGLRGLTVWHSEQNLSQIVAYPWAVRSLGQGCWLVDVCLGNAYQGVDFASHPSAGHLIRYLSGGVLRRGLFVGQCDGQGWVEDVQFNPHYTVRTPAGLPHPPYSGRTGGQVIDYQRHYLEGLVFGRCQDEQIRRTFLYAAHDGLAFRNLDGTPRATVIEHGTDTGSRALVLEDSDPRGITMADMQLVSLGQWEVGAIVAPPESQGRFRLFNTQIWGGHHSGRLEGAAQVLLQQVNTQTGGFVIRGGRPRLEQVHFGRDLTPHITVESPCESIELIAGTSAAGALRITNGIGNRCRAVANSCSLHPVTDRFGFATGWEPNQQHGLATTVATRGGGRRAVSEFVCAPAEGQARSGRWALHIAGRADDPRYSHIYFRVFDGPWGVAPDSMLSYWIRPENERGRSVGIDLLFTDGSTLRDSGLKAKGGGGVHPGNPRGAVGKWTRVVIPLGRRLAGKVIESILFAYDSRGGGGPFTAWVDDLQLTSASMSRPWRVDMHPQGGRVSVGTQVTLTSPDGAPVRYTLDGLNPTPTSPIAVAALTLTRPGLCEVRAAVDGLVFGQLYEVGE